MPSITWISHRIAIVLSAGALVAFIVIALLIVSDKVQLPTVAEAEQEVRILLKSEVNIRYLAALSETGTRVPDAPTATRWDEELRALDRVPITDTEVAIPLPSYLLGAPGYVVRTSIAGETRYFSVRPESSSERDAWIWWISL